MLTLEIIHNFVELLDQYFGSVCELDIIYNYEKVHMILYNYKTRNDYRDPSHPHILQAYFILDEFLLAGEIQDSSKKSILNAIRLQDFIQEEETPQGLFEDAGLG